MGAGPIALQQANVADFETVLRGEFLVFARTAAVIALLQVINSVYRLVPGHWGCPMLRHLLVCELAVGVGAMVAFARTSMILEPTLVSSLVLTLAALAALTVYDAVERAISDKLRVHKLKSCTATLSEQRPFRLFGSEQTLGSWAREGELSLHRGIARLLERPRRGRYGRARKIVVLLMMSLVATGMTSTATLATEWMMRDGQILRQAGASDNKRPAATTGGSKQGPVHQFKGAQPSDPKRGEDRSRASWAEKCGLRPGAQPDGVDRITERERLTLDALYLKGIDLNADGELDADDPPGAEGGCTGTPHVSARNGTRLVYVIGSDPWTGKRLSIAVVSGQFDPAIFIHPAVAPVLELIEMYGDIGGMRHLDVGSGQVYGVQTPYGTAILARPTTERRDGTGRAQPYVLLVPAAAAAWAKAMADHETWLWPLDGGIVEGRQRIRLVSDLSSDDTVATIFVDYAARKARNGGQSSWGGPFGPRISRDELRFYANGGR